VGAIFRKTLKTDMSSSSYSAGELTNLMSVDATSVLEYACYAHFIWTSALSIAISVGKQASINSNVHYLLQYDYLVTY
jgi:hypothetical protein